MLISCTQSDATLTKLFITIFDGKDFDADSQPLRRLKNIKFRHCLVSEFGVIPFMQRCPLLTHIDVSFTLLKHIPEVHPVPPIEKLSLTSTYVPASEVITMVSQLPKLKVLNVGVLGSGKASSHGPAGLSLDDEALLKLTDAMKECDGIESVNLVQNAKLGKRMSKHSTSALTYFITHVGRRCRVRIYPHCI